MNLLSTALRGLLALALLLTMASAAKADDTQSQHALQETAMANVWMSIAYDNTDGTTETLAQKYPGKALVVVNTASKCGYTKQYAALEALYQKYKDQGLVVVAFPSNDFGGQEPGTDEEIKTFCETKFNVTFPIKKKMSTAGETKSPLYRALTGPSSAAPGEVAWNFEKFVIGRDGAIVARFKSKVTPDSPEMEEAVQKALAKTPAP